MAGEFYGDLAPELNQGDIVDNIPWGLIVAPTTLCRPSDRAAASGKAFYADAASTKRPQPAWAYSPEFIHGAAHNGLAMVMWHGCQIDKWKNRKASRERDNAAKAFVGIAPVLPLDKFKPVERQRDVMEGQHHALFPIPGFVVGERTVPDSYVDLRHIWPVKQEMIVDRIVALSALGRDSLAGHLCMFFTRGIFDARPTCPNCGTAVPIPTITDEEDDAGA